jgi:hypothetical protein
MITPTAVVPRLGLERSAFKRLVVGDEIRDFDISSGDLAFFPYDERLSLLPIDAIADSGRRLWPTRTTLGNRATFAKLTYFQEGRPWYEWHQVTVDHAVSDLTITYAFMTTHNHFVLDRGGKVFGRSAPVIKLPEGATEDDHLALLGLLNSSTACFWLKQVSHCKNNVTVSSGIPDQPWSWNWEFTGKGLEALPVPSAAPLERARTLDRLAQDVAAVRPAAVCTSATPTRDALDQAHRQYDRLRSEMIATQEELDWHVYHLYGLLEEDLTAPEESLPRLNLGERAFEIVLARKMAAGEVRTQWFARHDSTPITSIPAHWPTACQAVVKRRIRVIEERPDIALIERTEYKRRWASRQPWEAQEKEALRDWLLDRLEDQQLWWDSGRARVLSVAQLADRVGADADIRSVLALYCGRDDYDLAGELTRLVAGEIVPYLAAYRYKPSGLRKREEWERTWDLQRREDNGEKVGPIPVPTKYGSEDFTKVTYWRNRRKLDVPTERFVSYPKTGRGGDKTPVLGWAGWNHLDQAQALATLYINRKTDEGWPAERLLPLLAGLVELEPWLHQWYADPLPGYPGSPAAFYTGLIDTELAGLGHGRADLAPEKLP